jgi:CRISPR-associated protein Cmr3
MKKAIFIEPLDVLLFRESKPFSGGEDHLARSVFPPPPSTVYAALRSHLLSCSFGRFEAFKKGEGVPAELAGEVGSPEKFGILELKRLLVARKKELPKVGREVLQVQLLFPMPKDVAKVKKEKPGPYALLKPAGAFPVHTNLPQDLEHLWFQKDSHLEPAGGWLTEAGMQRYLDGEPHSSESF